MELRQEQLLFLLIENYIQTAEPIGSKFLAEIGSLGVSGATIRNELSELEKAGYLTHPHTSAGRIPTEKGYKYYVEHLSGEKKLAKSVQEKIQELVQEHSSQELLLKALGKEASAFTQNAVIIAFGNDKIYYTGISYLFSQPEFQNVNHTIRVSSIFDHCEEHVPGLFEKASLESNSILIGSENPLGAVCSTVMAQVEKNILFALLGPMRMDYKKSMALVRYISEAMKTVSLS